METRYGERRHQKIREKIAIWLIDYTLEAILNIGSLRNAAVDDYSFALSMSKPKVVTRLSQI